MSRNLRLDALEIRPVQRQVYLSGDLVALGARAFDVLLALAERRDRLVSKNELMDLVWPGMVVEENNLTVQISALRKALGSDAITTVPGRGYRLALGGEASPATEAPASPPVTRLERRLVALARASVVGWDKLILRHADAAVPAWKSIRSELIEPSIPDHGGRLEDLAPERVEVVFGSTIDAAQWALHVQRHQARRRSRASGPPIHLRIAIVVDDVIVDDGKLLGMGLRALDEMHALAQHDEVLISDGVRAFLSGRLQAAFLPVDVGVRRGHANSQPLWLLQPPAEEESTHPTATTLLAAARRLPTLAVLPLRNLGAATDDYLATGLTEQVIAFLSLNKSMAVIAHGSTLGLQHESTNAVRAAQALGAEYVLTGSLQRQQLGLEIQVVLQHVSSPDPVLEQPFRGSLDALQDFQEQLAADIAAAIDPQVMATEMRRLMRRPTGSATAYDCLLRGMALLHDFAHVDENEAPQHFRQALALDPGYAQAHAALAWWHNLRVGEGRSSQREADRQNAINHALRAVELDPLDSTVLAVAGHIQAFLGKQFPQALALFDQALSINPSCAIAWARSATTLAYLGQGEQALARVQQAIRLSPRDPNRFAFFTTRGTASLVLGRYDESVAWLSQARKLNPGYKATSRLMIAALALCGDLQQARDLATEYLEIEPDFSVSDFGRWYPLQEPHLGVLLQALRQAGLPR